MKVQRVEWHSYQLVYEYDIPDEEIVEKFGDVESFEEKLASDDEDFDESYEYVMEEQDPVEKEEQELETEIEDLGKDIQQPKQ